ncbi:hypothetical protein [Nocardioides sp.]|uniref:hypothetical protein n=1 Tax=Nocardioides sp. TaxID=35761 RepID=UPI00260458D3|nr:hypothetical protein [Nocardioides sp.]
MLTDDELTSQLGGAMRESAQPLRYAGPMPRARRGPNGAWVAVPAMAAAAAVGVAVIHDQAPTGAPQVTATGTPRPGTNDAVVTDTFTVAGYTVSVRHRAGDRLADDAVIVDGPAPAGAERLRIDGSAQAWLGTDAQGRNGLWVISPVRNGGRSFGIVSPTWSKATLRTIAFTGFPDGLTPRG